jgi:hypothetical protein
MLTLKGLARSGAALYLEVLALATSTAGARTVAAASGAARNGDRWLR